MAGRVGTTALVLAGSLMITRRYGAEAMGILALVVAVFSIAAVPDTTTQCQQHVGC